MPTSPERQHATKVEIDAELFERLLMYCRERGIDLDAVIESRCELHLARAEAGLAGVGSPHDSAHQPWSG